MRFLDAVAPVTSPASNSTSGHDGDSGGGPRVLYGWLFDCHGFWHNVPLIVFSAMFVLYLASHARKSFTKLSQGRSYIMISYYGVLWFVSVLNLAWCSLQVRSFAVLECPFFLQYRGKCSRVWKGGVVDSFGVIGYVRAFNS